MRIIKIFFLIVFLIFSLNSVFAQINYETLNFEPLETNIGTRAISCIVKDHKGIIWIGTQGNGLSSFNGYEIKNYKHRWNDKKTINNSVINVIFIDKQNNIWVGTEEGLNLYNRDLDEFIHIPLNELDSKIQVKAINETDDNTILVGTHGFGIFKVDIETHLSTNVLINVSKNINSFQVNSIKTTARGAVLIGSNIGLLRYKTATQSIDYAQFTTLKGTEIIKNHIQTILTENDDIIWIGTVNDGLIKILTTPTNYYEFKFHPITNKRVLALETDRSGTIFCGTENDGLFVFGGDKKFISLKYNKSEPKGIKSNSIWSVFIDENNRIWLGYFNQGVDIYDEEKERFKSIESIPNKDQSLYSKSVTAITMDNEDRFWFGIADGGVDVYNSKTQEFTHLIDQNNPIAKGLTSSDIVSVFIDSKGNVWVGTWNSGIFFLEKGKKRFKNIQPDNSNGIFKSSRIMSFAEDSEGTIWIGSFLSGLYSFNPYTGDFVHHQEKALREQYIDSKNIRKVLVDYKDNIWLGTRTGLFKVSNIKTQPKVESYNALISKDLNTTTKFNIITTLYEDKKKNIWIGTEGYGLCQLNTKNNTTKWYNTSKNFIHQSITSIVETEPGIFWFTGNNGMTKFNLKKNSFTNYNTEDGILANNFNKNSVFRSKEGILYFGCHKGINFFNPEDITINFDTPKVYLSDFKLSNKSVRPNEENSPLQKVIKESNTIELKYNQSFFTIDYYGLSYTHSKNLEYAYFLEGVESDWNYVGKTRNATYTNIPPGDYNFKVKAANSDGVWSDSPTTLNIKILPPWWETNLASFLFLFVFLIVIYNIYKFINIRVKERLEIKTEREERKQLEGLNAKKIQFFTNISHEFRTPLTLILNPLEDIIADENLKLPKNIKEKHKIIYKNSKRLSRLINELMDFRKLQFNKMEVNVSKFNLIPFVKEVTSHFEEEAMQRNIHLEVENKVDTIDIWADPSMLEKIIFNLLSNAFKATKNSGRVSLKIYETKKEMYFPLIKDNKLCSGICISISDSGIGIKEDELNNIFSRFYQVKELDKQYYGGTGIGLEVVKSFVDLHKGKIDVKSQNNIGTQFKIYFPKGNQHFNKKLSALKSNSNHSNFEQIDDSLDQIDLKNIKKIETKKTILIVEDNPELKNYLRNELKTIYKIKTAENGQEGLEKALKFMPDIIITDIMMPIMDGFEFCKKVKNDIRISHIPLMMMTAKGMQIDKIKGIDSGADVYITKPFNMSVMKSHIKQLITSRQILFEKYFNGIKNEDLSKTTSVDKEFITKILEYINNNISDSKLSVEHLADELLVSRSKLYRKIKALTGDTATEFIRKIRLEKANELLEKTDLTVSEIGYKVGFSSPSYFTKCFKNHFGIIPKDVRFQK
jgi:signal transduction histidine kinase/ligand-binding sensor domain-containing protein/DNA-binding response OmpR family regulator